MRSYETTHPWINFRATDINKVAPNQWMLLGEAKSKCEHLAGVPLEPTVAQQLYLVTLIKGALGTTAIEGNTLTEDQVRAIIAGTATMPPSRQYQETEVKNVLNSLGEIQAKILRREEIALTVNSICEFNQQILNGLELEPGVVAGDIRTYSVAVPNYRGAPAEDCEFLLHQLIDWLNSPVFQSEDPELNFALTIAKAIYAHLYIAWIHPFGDGNGRTARLVEFQILAASGVVPIPAAHLLSNHYNLTRDVYYRELEKASRVALGDTIGFLTYAIQGFVDGIRQVIEMVRGHQFDVAWINYVHERFARLPNSVASDRQRSLVLAMPLWQAVSRVDLEGLTPKIARLYAKAGPRTLSRDLNTLLSLGLIRKVGKQFEASSELVLAFLAPRAENGI